MNVAPASRTARPLVFANFANGGLDSKYPLFRGAEVKLPAAATTTESALVALVDLTEGAHRGAVLVQDGGAVRAFGLVARGTQGEKAWNADLYAPLQLGSPNYTAAVPGVVALVDGHDVTFPANGAIKVVS